MNERNYTQRNKKSKKAQETEQSCIISKELFFIALYCEAGFSAAEKGTTQSVLANFLGSIINSIFMIWIGHLVELTETIKNYAYRISIGIHSLLIPFNKSVKSGAQSLIFFINLYIRLRLILFLAWSVISTSSPT